MTAFVLLSGSFPRNQPVFALALYLKQHKSSFSTNRFFAILCGVTCFGYIMCTDTITPICNWRCYLVAGKFIWFSIHLCPNSSFSFLQTFQVPLLQCLHQHYEDDRSSNLIPNFLLHSHLPSWGWVSSPCFRGCCSPAWYQLSFQVTSVQPPQERRKEARKSAMFSTTEELLARRQTLDPPSHLLSQPARVAAQVLHFSSNLNCN